MGQAKLKQRAAFAPQLIEEWEAEDCVNFAVALARLTGWILHVDWWSTSTTRQEEISVDQLKPLRVYVGDNRDKIFDVRGIRSLVEFSGGVIVKVARRIATGPGSVYTRYYDETKLASLPLRRQPDEQRIARATEAILGNHLFLGEIPRRPG